MSILADDDPLAEGWSHIAIYAEALVIAAEILLYEREQHGQPSEAAWQLVQSVLHSYHHARKENP